MHKKKETRLHQSTIRFDIHQKKQPGQEKQICMLWSSKAFPNPACNNAVLAMLSLTLAMLRQPQRAPRRLSAIQPAWQDPVHCLQGQSQPPYQSSTKGLGAVTCSAGLGPECFWLPGSQPGRVPISSCPCALLMCVRERETKALLSPARMDCSDLLVAWADGRGTDKTDVNPFVSKPKLSEQWSCACVQCLLFCCLVNFH